MPVLRRNAISAQTMFPSLCRHTRLQDVARSPQPPHIAQSPFLSLTASSVVSSTINLEHVRTNTHPYLCHSSTPVQHTFSSPIPPSASQMDETVTPTLHPRCAPARALAHTVSSLQVTPVHRPRVGRGSESRDAQKVTWPPSTPSRLADVRQVSSLVCREDSMAATPLRFCFHLAWRRLAALVSPPCLEFPSTEPSPICLARGPGHPAKPFSKTNAHSSGLALPCFQLAHQLVHSSPSPAHHCAVSAPALVKTAQTNPLFELVPSLQHIASIMMKCRVSRIACLLSWPTADLRCAFSSWGSTNSASSCLVVVPPQLLRRLMASLS
ncbi:hypothetical protein LZ30DRAFT_309811 [Colletotrichum cereale]|nr:hypothetical protein LZ30DRAFT_309811 [Colletotrichum cereale]